ncbi:hypothetical protein [Aidingimonas lacisalsi]|uniref:hypothetical protein n=1 Tax=Aidingimonas lacisalsi TaxID=2604086 RepID=UPI001F3D8414|nr:hypothetical protein [Aidingimonas lacisalsi]
MSDVQRSGIEGQRVSVVTALIARDFRTTAVGDVLTALQAVVASMPASHSEYRGAT